MRARLVLASSLVFLMAAIFVFLSPELMNVSRETFAAETANSNRARVCAGSDLPMRMRTDGRQLQHADLRFLGADARAKSTRMIGKGNGPRRRSSHSIARKYGEKILSAPTTEGFNLLAWMMPFVALAVGGGLIVLVFGRWRSVAPPSFTGDSTAGTRQPSFDPELARKLEKEIEERRVSRCSSWPQRSDRRGSRAVRRRAARHRAGRRARQVSGRTRSRALEHERALAVQGLRELEFDREMGKLSDADYDVDARGARGSRAHCDDGDREIRRQRHASRIRRRRPTSAAAAHRCRGASTRRQAASSANRRTRPRSLCRGSAATADRVAQIAVLPAMRHARGRRRELLRANAGIASGRAARATARAE